jgi:hypothetical protein
MNNLNLCNSCNARTQETRTTKNTSLTNNYIIETVRNIDRMQKEVSKETGCTGCNDLLVSQTTFFNTKPVIFRFGNGEAFTALAGTVETNTFRIQELRGSVVILRLLTLDDTTGEYTCTNNTVLLDLDCVCSLQCLAPINCPCCANAATV